MPIRINLLAEQLAAEEARRKDPVKRALYVAVGLVVVMLLWSAMAILGARGAARELADYQLQLTNLDAAAKEVRVQKAQADDAYYRAEQLDRYATNRFLWGNVLNDLQMAVKKVEGIRVEDFMAEHTYSTNAEVKTKQAFKLPYTPEPAAWKFWAADPPAIDYNKLVADEFKALTNKAPYLTNRVPVKMRLVNLVTNNAESVTANIEVITPVTATEHTSIIIRARDYNQERRTDAFSKALAEGAYMKERLLQGPDGGIFLRGIERQKEDGSMNPPQLYTPFTIEAQFEPRTFTSE